MGVPYLRTTRNWLNTSWICLRLIIWREERLDLGTTGPRLCLR